MVFCAVGRYSLAGTRPWRGLSIQSKLGAVNKEASTSNASGTGDVLPAADQALGRLRWAGLGRAVFDGEMCG